MYIGSNLFLCLKQYSLTLRPNTPLTESNTKVPLVAHFSL